MVIRQVGFTLGGLVAGEGTFFVTTKQPPYQNGDPRLQFVFEVKMATRDRPLLVALQNFLGVGSIHDSPPRKPHHQPISAYRVHSLRSIHAKVIPFADRFLLASAKRQQYELWKQAIHAYALEHPTRWGKGHGTCSVEGCGKPVRGRGLCRSHYYRATGW